MLTLPTLSFPAHSDCIELQTAASGWCRALNVAPTSGLRLSQLHACQQSLPDQSIQYIQLPPIPVWFHPTQLSQQPFCYPAAEFFFILCFPTWFPSTAAESSAPTIMAVSSIAMGLCSYSCPLQFLACLCSSGPILPVILYNCLAMANEMNLSCTFTIQMRQCHLIVVEAHKNKDIFKILNHASVFGP